MLPLKKIFCPVDFSGHSLEALKVAGELAKSFSAEIFLMHVVTPIPVAVGSGTAPAPTTYNIPLYEKEMMESAEKSMKETVENSTPEGVKTRSAVVMGDAADEIVQKAAEENADLIVIATHGRTGIKRFFFGSVAENVLRHTTRPVLMVPIKKEEK